MRSQHEQRDRALVEGSVFGAPHLVWRRSTAPIVAGSARMLSRSALMAIEQYTGLSQPLDAVAEYIRREVSPVASVEAQ